MDWQTRVQLSVTRGQLVLRQLSNEQLIECIDMAQELRLEEEFIVFLSSELHRRQIEDLNPFRPAPIRQNMRKGEYPLTILNTLLK